MSSLQKMMLNLTQLMRLREHNRTFSELEKLGAIDMYYLEAIYQLKDPTVGTISRLLGQSTPNTNYHIKKLINIGLVEKKVDEEDHRVAHLMVTNKYTSLISDDQEFWQSFQERLEDQVDPTDITIFQRVLRQAIEIISEENLETLEQK
ncbi:MarR family winged helix-turn-helix transcriptional regulator [Ligilactobacillus equi]|nr:MarR family transcriptional regulator [Ligilactobacillus equi]KRL77065.1 hypothetical protein FC36_GL001467 [Ligilactobacillus equi DSM 15833 = JCM 10991]MCQ2556444.1 MarR family winged helix-turn-helix transcriptional regulator [Ligilactobacillus sp.]